MKNGIVFIIDIRNTQTDYARAFQLIKTLNEAYNNNQIIDTKPLVEIVRKTREHIAINYARVNKSLNVLEIEKLIKYPAKINPISDVSKMIATIKQYDISYYIRIKSLDSEEDIVNLQYLALILQFFKKSEKHPNILSFIIPLNDTNEQTYPYGKESLEGPPKNYTNIYHKASHFLRLSNQASQVYGAYWNTKEKKIVINPLSKIRKGTQGTFVPLIQINHQAYNFLISHYAPTEETVNLIAELYEIGKAKLLSVMKKDAIPKADRDQKYEESLDKINQYFPDLNVFSFVITAFLLDSLDNLLALMPKAISMCNGILQAIENVIYHTENSIGCLAIRIHQDIDQREYIKTVYPGMEVHQLPLGADKDTKAVEVFVSDINFNNNIVTNFLKGNHAEITKVFSEDDKNSIALSDLFKDYNNESTKESWVKYRGNHATLHLGLPRLYDEIKSLKGALKVKSFEKFSDEPLSRKHLYYKLFNSEINSKNISDFYIPGTQLSMLIPLSSIKLDQHRLQYAGYSYTETFSDYAQYLDLSISEVYFANTNGLITDTGAFSRQNIPNQKEKNKLVEKWKECFNDKYKCIKTKRVIVVIDIPSYEESIYKNYNRVIIEAFCKGFISSEFIQGDGVLYFSFLNATKEFLLLFYGTLLEAHLGENFANQNKQVFISAKEYNWNVILWGKNKKQIVYNSNYYLMKQNYSEPRESLLSENEILASMFFGDDVVSATTSKKIDHSLVPFEILVETAKNHSFFINQFKEAANNLINTGTNRGYKIQDTHMKLGSKIHIKDFYEMSVFFRKNQVAKKLAYIIIRETLELPLDVGKEDSEKIKSLIFYGYASYSMPLLNSIIEIIKQYKNNNKTLLSENRIHKILMKYDFRYIVYQNDLLLNVSLDDVMLYSPQDMGDLRGDVAVVQIVPISSTLTTFGKMWNKLISDKKSGPFTFKLKKNYTAFWVKDIPCSPVPVEGKIVPTEGEIVPTEQESKFWEKACEKEKRIKVTEKVLKDETYQNIYYLYSQETQWYEPLKCKKCWPGNVLNEYPLVETDSTSTIPSQQLTSQSNDKKSFSFSIAEIDTQYNLIGESLKYGHFSRSKNHFQYYIDTQQFFIKNSGEIADWLDKKVPSGTNDSYTYNLIIVPQHHTNIGFAACVNDRYFQGLAEVIVIDSEKEYRSNIISKYKDVTNSIEVLLENSAQDSVEINIYYVDDTIITGETFQRTCSLLKSILPSSKATNPTGLFNGIFVLVNRLSNASKFSYISDASQFHSFCDVSVSSMRSHGDSCTICKLQKDANSLYKKSATKSMSKHWHDKVYSYQSTPYDKKENGEYNDNGLYRFVLSDAIGKQLECYSNKKEIFECYIEIFSTYISDYSTTKDQIKLIKLLKNTIKVISRPFFTFNADNRHCATILFIYFAETLLFTPDKMSFNDANIFSEPPEFYAEDAEDAEDTEDDAICKIKHLCVELRTILVGPQRYDLLITLFEALTDMKSTYLLRKQTLVSVYEFLEMKGHPENAKDFYDLYNKWFFYLTNVGNDESKSLWVENLLLYNEEIEKNNVNSEKQLSPNFQAKLSASEKGVKKYERSFVYRAFIENSKVFYDTIENLFENDISDDSFSHYYVDNLREIFALLPKSEGSQGSKAMSMETHLKAAINFYNEFVRKSDDGLSKDGFGVDWRYEKLAQAMRELLIFNSKSNLSLGALDEKGENFALIGGLGSDNNKQFSERADLESKIEEHIVEANDDKCASLTIGEDGVYLATEYSLIKLDNNYEVGENSKRLTTGMFQQNLNDNQRILPVYIYIDYSKVTKNDQVNTLYRLLDIRNILMFRNQLIKQIEADFNSNTISQLNRQITLSQLLSQEKAGDHAARSDIDAIQMNLQKEACDVKQSEPQDDSSTKELDARYYLLLKTYVNMRISRLYRTMQYRATLGPDSNKHNKSELYEIIKENNKNQYNPAVRNIGDAFSSASGDLSPINYLTPIIKACDVYVKIDSREKLIETKEAFCEQLHLYDVFTDSEYSFKREYFISLFLDVFFSAIKHGFDWEAPLPATVPETVDGEYLYLTGLPRGEKIKVLMYREVAQHFPFDYLVFENKKYYHGDADPEKNRDSTINYEKNKSGYSISTFDWYIRGLHPELRNPDTNLNYSIICDVIKSGGAGAGVIHDIFKMKLPILKKEGELNE